MKLGLPIRRRPRAVAVVRVLFAVVAGLALMMFSQREARPVFADHEFDGCDYGQTTWVSGANGSDMWIRYDVITYWGDFTQMWQLFPGGGRAFQGAVDVDRDHRVSYIAIYTEGFHFAWIDCG